MRDYIPIASDPVDLTSADHTFERKVHGIRSEVAGDFAATLVGEGTTAEFSHVYSVTAGETIVGVFASVERATSDAVFQNATTLLGLTLPKDQ